MSDLIVQMPLERLREATDTLHGYRHMIERVRAVLDNWESSDYVHDDDALGQIREIVG